MTLLKVSKNLEAVSSVIKDPSHEIVTLAKFKIFSSPDNESFGVPTVKIKV